MSILRTLLDKYEKHKNAISFWRKKGAKIGDDCEIYTTANLGSEPYLIKIGNHVRINSGVEFVTHDGGVWVCREYIKDINAKQIDLFGKIEIGNNVHIGTNSIIMPNVRIGNNCIIGCGTIVTKNIPDNSIAVGVPAKIIETLDEYIEKNQSKFEYTKALSKNEKKYYLMRKL